jgi:hypothetical protein
MVGETVLGVVINIVMAGIVTAVTDRAEAFNGAALAYVASDMAKATTFPILAFGIGLTLVTRKRMSNGVVAPWAAPAPAWAPRNLGVRMALLVAIALVVLGAPGTLALHGLGAANALTPLGLMLFKLAYGVAIGIMVTPVVLALALWDRPAPREPGSGVDARSAEEMRQGIRLD